MASVVNHALFINGIFRTVLDQILATQANNPGHPLFLRPSSSSPIAMLKTRPPTSDAPVILYASTTDDLNMVSHTAEVIKWEDITDISPARIEHVNEILSLHQPCEGLISGQSESSINLLSIRRLTKFLESFSTGELVKVSDGQPLSDNRTRAGGWSPVYPLNPGLEGT